MTAIDARHAPPPPRLPPATPSPTTTEPGIDYGAPVLRAALISVSTAVLAGATAGAHVAASALLAVIGLGLGASHVHPRAQIRAGIGTVVAALAGAGATWGFLVGLPASFSLPFAAYALGAIAARHDARRTHRGRGSRRSGGQR